MKIASWNVNSLKVRMPHLLRWLEASKPDVVALQETKTEDLYFPVLELIEAGYRCVYAGQKTYNGVAILARQPPHDVITDIAQVDDASRRIIAASIGEPGASPDQVLRVVNLYVVNGKAVGDPKYDFKLEWLEQVRQFLAEELKRYPRLVVLGDFNIAPTDKDVYDPEAWHEKILCSTPEREALQGITKLGLHDSFRLFHDEQGQFSWWDYRQAAFDQNHGLRIDLVLLSDALKKVAEDASIERDPRTWDRPSDHTPVTVKLKLKP